MKCLYEVLGIEQGVDDAAIRSAYRKLALKWHPDKNQGNLAHAEEQFKEIQNAYEILGDPHERAWYDGHRDAILRSGERHQAGGGGGFTPGERPDDEVDLYAYFTATAYSGFGDGPRGFYSVYRELFKTMAQQEGVKLPEFGTSQSPWPEVGAFYAEWSNFRTTKDFAWADKYNPAAGENRRVRRAMEQENEKARKVVKKEYNENVRELVAFLRKRDKRVAAHQVEEAKRRVEREEADKARREAERLERIERARQYQEAEWTTTVESEEEEEEWVEEEQLLYYCIACEKHFKSEAALTNHERSKKHLERLELLKASLEQEEAELGDIPSDLHDGEVVAEEISSSEASSSEASTDDETGSGGDDDIDAADFGSELSAQSSSSDENTGDHSSFESDVESDSEADRASSTTSESSSQASMLDEDDETMLERLILSHTGGKPQNNSSSSSSSSNTSSSSSSSSSSDNVNEDDIEDIVDRKLKSSHASGYDSEVKGGAEEEEEDAQPVTSQAGLGSNSSDDNDWDMPAKGKQRKQQARQKNKKTSVKSQPPQNKEQKPVPKPAGAERTETNVEWACSICLRQFPSRNALFKHIKSTGHAALK